MDLDDYLKLAVDKQASDLYFLAGAPTCIKIDGEMSRINESVLTDECVKKLAYGILNKNQIKAFETYPELNLAISPKKLGRFRVNLYKQRGAVSMVIRTICSDIPTVEQLQLPEITKHIMMKQRGLILFVGATGVGKSTSMASLINYRSQQTSGHIITIEDPIEFLHSHQKSLITQREIGLDTDSYEDALKNTLRQAPDVILIGEIRSRHTMEHALSFCETGHLCLSTLHANNANQAIERITNFFPDEQRDHILLDLSLNLAGIVSQRLVRTVDNSRTAAFEILLGTPLVCDLIKRNAVEELKEVMQKSEHLGMQTIDASLLHLYEKNQINFEEALRNADSQNNLRLAISLGEKQRHTAPNLSMVDLDKKEDE